MQLNANPSETARDATTSTPKTRPDISLLMPCFNEEEVVGYTISRLVRAFQNTEFALELIAIDNGSSDKTGEIIKELAAVEPTVSYYRIDVNEGYGNGVLAGIPLATAPWVGIIPADGQTDAEDVVRLFAAAVTPSQHVLAKVRRRFRMDGLRRKIISVAYNLFIRCLWPGLESIDINGTPKMIRRDHLTQMNLKSKDWFLDPEIMIKAYYMGIPVLELNVFARMRSSGCSHVRVGTCWEFFRNLLIFRFSGEMLHWRRTRAKEALQATALNES